MIDRIGGKARGLLIFLSLLDELLYEIAFANARGGRLFKLNVANIEINDNKAITKSGTIIQIF